LGLQVHGWKEVQISERKKDMKDNGGFIVFEGADGAGTTTQSKLLAEELEKRFGPENVIWTCEPSTGPIGAFIRTILRGEVDRTPGNEAMKLLFTTDRLDHIETDISPALSAGKWVVCDRFYLSTLVYQGATDILGRFGDRISVGMRLEHLQTMRTEMENRMKLKFPFPFPDVTLILDVNPDEIARRRERRGGKTEIFESCRMQNEVCLLYSEWGKRNPRHENCVMVDGWMSIASVKTRCLEIIEETFK
jgi:dTMP kinase